MTLNLQGKTASVAGIGISNLPLIRFLLDRGIRVTARDQKSREKLGDLANTLEKEGVTLILGEQYLDGIRDDLVFRSPGIRFDKPGLLDAAAHGCEITSEMELFFRLCPATIIGITGSDGKTTTTTLIAKILEAAGKTVYVGGNIGRPLLPLVDQMKPTDFAVVELSSFQLHTMRLSPHVAVVTNLSPNHLDYHRGMEEYRAAKTNIFLHQKPGDRLVLNAGNAETRSMAEEAAPGTEVVFFNNDKETGVYERDGMICHSGRPILALSDIRLPGRHNVENYMAAIAATDGYVTKEAIEEVARTFGGVEHRIEFVRTLDGVTYYNSSIDSSPTRTAAALRSFTQKVIVICGGYDKHIPFDSLGDLLCEHAKTVVLTGATAPMIEKAVTGSSLYREGAPRLIRQSDFANAVSAAREAAAEGDIVILSPACASFDAFPNFEVRGNTFKELVRGF